MNEPKSQERKKHKTRMKGNKKSHAKQQRQGEKKGKQQNKKKERKKKRKKAPPHTHIEDFVCKIQSETIAKVKKGKEKKIQLTICKCGGAGGGDNISPQ